MKSSGSSDVSKNFGGPFPPFDKLDVMFSASIAFALINEVLR